MTQIRQLTHQLILHTYLNQHEMNNIFRWSLIAVSFHRSFRRTNESLDQ